MGLPRLKSRCQQGYGPFWKICKVESVFCPFQLLGPPTSLDSQCSSSISKAHDSRSSPLISYTCILFSPSSMFKDPWDYLGLPGSSKISPLFQGLFISNLNSMFYLNSSLSWNLAYARILGIRTRISLSTRVWLHQLTSCETVGKLLKSSWASAFLPMKGINGGLNEALQGRSLASFLTSCLAHTCSLQPSCMLHRRLWTLAHFAWKPLLSPTLPAFTLSYTASLSLHVTSPGKPSWIY